MPIKLTLKAKVLFSVACLYSLLVLFLSLANLNDVEIVQLEASDKIYHLICYTALSFLWTYFAKVKLKALKSGVILKLVLSISLFGIIIEVLQLTLTDYRSFDWWDVVANFTGTVLGIIVFKLFQKIFNY